MRKISVALLVLLVCLAAAAQGTRTWEQGRYEEFEKGTSKGVAIRSDGELVLAPAFKQIATTPSTYLWNMASDRDGNIYAAAGSPARVYRITPAGQVSIVFEPQELQVQALVVDAAHGAIYAATSPDGRIYRIALKPGTNAAPAQKAAAPAQGAASGAAATRLPVDANFTSSVYFEPRTKYIWALALDGSGNVYAATGDRGEIFKITGQGQGGVFFKSDEGHIRSLAFDHDGNLIAGSDGSGLIYRISPRGEGFVLYSAPKKEITALAVDEKNNIYAAGVGEKRAVGAVGAPIMIAPPAPAPQAPLASQAPMPLPGGMLPGAAVVGGSDIYEIAPDGSPRRVWASRDDIVYSLAYEPARGIIAGTGNKGRIFAVADRGGYTDLLRTTASQVTGFATAPNGGLYVATSNLGKVFLVGGAPESEGSFTSDVFDAKIFSRWGRVQVRGTGGYQLFARSGNVDNPDRNWSPWQQVALDRGAELNVPAARFVQWKAVLVSGNPAPRIDSVLINYLPKNIAPTVADVTVQVGTKFSAQPRTLADAQAPAPQANSQHDRDWIGVKWDAHDDNDDRLAYSIYYRGENERQWRLLKDKLIDRFYAFQSALLPDGAYYVRVVATDAPSHTPDEALSDQHESARFEVDNTPPVVADLAGTIDPASGALHITFRANDSLSVVSRAEYSVDAGDWQVVEPVGRISDSRSEMYDFSVALPGATPRLAPRKGAPAQTPGGDGDASAEHIVVVRVWDRADNMATAKTVVRTAPAKR